MESVPIDGVNRIQRAKILVGRTAKKETGCGNMYVTCNRCPDTAKLIEIFVMLGKAGSCQKAQLESMARNISRSLRYGVPISEIIKDNRGIRCEKPVGLGPNKVTSCSDAIGQILQDEIDWEKTDEFKRFWESNRGHNAVREGSGEGEEVCEGCEGRGEDEIVPDAGSPVEKKGGQ